MLNDIEPIYYVSLIHQVTFFSCDYIQYLYSVNICLGLEITILESMKWIRTVFTL